MSDIGTYHNYSANTIQELIKVAKGLIWSRKSKRDTKYNWQKKEDRKTTNKLQNTTQEIKDWALQTGENSGAPEKLAVHVPPVTPIMLNDKNIVWYGNRIGCQDTLINTNNSSQDKWGVKTFIHLWPSTRHLNILTNQATTHSWHVLFLYLMN